MSRAAEELARAIVHPNVKGSRRALLDTIARLILEGEEMTRPIDDDELAAQSGYRESSIYRARKFLVAHRLIRVIGGQGKVASYALSSMDAPALPLIGVAKPMRTSRSGVSIALPLVEVIEAPIRSYTVGQNDGGWRSYFRHFDGSWSRYFRHFRHLRHFDGSWSRFWAYTVGHFDGSARMDVDVDPRARDVHTLKNVHTHTAPRAEIPDEQEPVAPPIAPPIAPPRHSWHAWCGPRACVPHFLHADFCRKQQRPGEVLTDVAIRMFVFYGKRSPTGPIGDKDDAAFWRRMYGEEFASVPPVTERAPPAPRPHWCRDHDPPCQRWTEHNARLHADVVAAREQKSG